jgi:hypothetical protein
MRAFESLRRFSRTEERVAPPAEPWNSRGVDEGELAVRRATYRLFVELGRAPTADEVGSAVGSTRDDVRAAWRQLHESHALVLHAGSGDLRMANPFSAVPTAHRVHAAERWWYANCAWDAIGICSALHVDGQVLSSCPDCGDTIEFDVQQTRPSDETLVFHCLVPATEWWSDIGFT